MRSLLFAPADSTRKMTKALSCGADVVLLDLEDAIAAGEKVRARESAAAFLREAGGGKGPPLYVRINDLESGEADADLKAVVPAHPHGIMLPKARSAADIHALNARLDALEEEAGLEAGSLSVLVLAVEIPDAVLNIAGFAERAARVTGYAWGGEDMAAGIGAASNRDADGRYTAPLALARNLCLFAAAAAGVHAIDTVFTDFRDSSGLERDAREAARDGFSGKMAIHPDQIAVINDAFTPDAAEIAHAREIEQAFAAAPGAGVVNLEGRMVDRPHLQHALRTLERARAAGLV